MQLQHAINSVRDVCKLKHLSVQTEKSYVHWVRRYGAFLLTVQLPPAQASETKMEAFLTSLARAGVSASTQNQAFNALLFLYREVFKQELVEIHALRAKRPASLRYCPTQAEVTQLLAQVGDLYGYPTRLITNLLYACGLRVCEPLNLRIKAVDLKQSRLYLHHAKGSKGRVVNSRNALPRLSNSNWPWPEPLRSKTVCNASRLPCLDYWATSIPGQRFRTIGHGSFLPTLHAATLARSNGCAGVVTRTTFNER